MTQVTWGSQVLCHEAAHVLGPGLREVKGGGGANTRSHQVLGPPPEHQPVVSHLPYKSPADLALASPHLEPLGLGNPGT